MALINFIILQGLDLYSFVWVSIWDPPGPQCQSLQSNKQRMGACITADPLQVLKQPAAYPHRVSSSEVSRGHKTGIDR